MILDATTPMGDLHSHPSIRALYGPEFLVPEPVSRNYVPNQVQFYTHFLKSPDYRDFRQTERFKRRCKNANVRFWEADLGAGWGAGGACEKKACFWDRPGSGRDPLGRYDLPTLILRRRSGRGGCPARLREVIIPKKEVIIRVKNEI